MPFICDEHTWTIHYCVCGCGGVGCYRDGQRFVRSFCYFLNPRAFLDKPLRELTLNLVGALIMWLNRPDLHLVMPVEFSRICKQTVEMWWVNTLSDSPVVVSVLYHWIPTAPWPRIGPGVSVNWTQTADRTDPKFDWRILTETPRPDGPHEDLKNGHRLCCVRSRSHHDFGMIVNKRW